MEESAFPGVLPGRRPPYLGSPHSVLDLPAFILPGPGLVWERFLITLKSGQLGRHTLITLLEVLAGLLAGSLFATLLGYLLAKSPTLEKLIAPYLVASQSIPMVAIAPPAGHLVWPGDLFQGPDLRVDRFLSSPDQHSGGIT